MLVTSCSVPPVGKKAIKRIGEAIKHIVLVAEPSRYKLLTVKGVLAVPARVAGDHLPDILRSEALVVLVHVEREEDFEAKLVGSLVDPVSAGLVHILPAIQIVGT